METSALFKDSYNGKLRVPLETSLHLVIKTQTQAPIIQLCWHQGGMLTIFIDCVQNGFWEYYANGQKACFSEARRR